MATDRQILEHEARSNLAAFILANHDDYQMGWFCRELCTVLMQFFVDVRKGRRPRLIITAPPRHGKSQVVSRDFPSWTEGVYPDAHIIASSYNQDLANSMSRDVQEIMKSESYRRIFPKVNLIERKSKKTKITAAQTAKYFEIPGRKGRYVAAGVGSGITGKGALIAIIDDPFKDANEADSATIRENVWKWYTSTLRTRLAPGGGIIIMHTRWHEDDLVGRLLIKAAQGNGEKFQIINYPAIAEEDEPHRKKGEALHPERYDLEELKSIKQAVGTRVWNALYQQHPTPLEGGLFKRSWLKFYIPGEEPKEWDALIQSWDLPFSKTETSDDCAGGVLGLKNVDIYILDIDSAQRTFAESLKAFEIMTNKWPDAFEKIVENKANGPAMESMFTSGIPGFPKIPGIILNEPKGSKVQRAKAVEPFVESGHLWLPDPRYCSWSQRVIEQLVNFPNVAHDDIVDIITQGISRLNKKSNDSLWS